MDENTLTKPTVATLRGCLQGLLPHLPEDPQVDLFSTGIIDSLSLIEVVLTLENIFAITFEPRNLKAENFCTLERLAETVDDILTRSKT